MKKKLDKFVQRLVALNKQTYFMYKNIQRLEVQFTRTSNFYDRKWGDWYLISGHSGDCL